MVSVFQQKICHVYLTADLQEKMGDDIRMRQVSAFFYASNLLEKWGWIFGRNLLKGRGRPSF